MRDERYLKDLWFKQLGEWTYRRLRRQGLRTGGISVCSLYDVKFELTITQPRVLHVHNISQGI